MRTFKHVDHRDGSRCGCEYSIDKRGQESWSRLCMEHEREFIERHMAAVASCSHVNRDLTGG